MDLGPSDTPRSSSSVCVLCGGRPVLYLCCGHRACTSCILRHNSACPTCGEPVVGIQGGDYQSPSVLLVDPASSIPIVDPDSLPSDSPAVYKESCPACRALRPLELAGPCGHRVCASCLRLTEDNLCPLCYSNPCNDSLTPPPPPTSSIPPTTTTTATNTNTNNVTQPVNTSNTNMYSEYQPYPISSTSSSVAVSTNPSKRMREDPVMTSISGGGTSNSGYNYSTNSCSNGGNGGYGNEDVSGDVNVRYSTKLRGKVVLVTGGSGSLGSAVSEAFARHGAKVVVNYAHDAKRAEGVVWRIRAFGGDAVAIRADVSRAEDAERLVRAAVAGGGQLDAVVCCAGIAGPVAAVHETAAAEWSRVFAVNVDGVFNIIRAAVPILSASSSTLALTSESTYSGRNASVGYGTGNSGGLEEGVRGIRGGGSIVVVTSAFARKAPALRTAYAAAAAAVEVLVKGVAKEGRETGIRANCVAAGRVRTEALEEAAERTARETGRTKEDVLEDVIRAGTGAGIGGGLGRLAEAEEVAEAVVFLAGNSASGITGTTLEVGGGCW